MKITFQQAQRNVTDIANRQSYSIDVLYELMAAYGRSASSITKLRNGVINLAEDKKTTVLQRGVVYFKIVPNSDSFPAEVEKLEQDPLTVRYNPRYLIATDLVTFAAKDTKKGNTLHIKWVDLDRNVDFFYGWTGDEVVDEKTEAVADRRAADKMKELYFEVEKINLDRLSDKQINFRHELNVFFTRLLFCFFAEDTRVFKKDGSNIFTSSIKDFTQTDGSDLDTFLGTLFEALDSKEKNNFTSPFSTFPYVNGSLFDNKKEISIPRFNAQTRKLILDCGALSWAQINPDIFGSMFQSIVDEEQRETHGMHYTSVPNIMKTIEPLFLDELREEFDANYEDKRKLGRLWERISKIKVFDPACGSGNFLIIAYKELRKLEHAIIDRIFDEEYEKAALSGKLTSRIDLNNFYGIEIDDFACEVAVLSLYIAKHQMNIEFEKQFGKRIELIPLEDKANIVRANAARIEWQEVCPNIPHYEGTPTSMQVKLLPEQYEQEELLKLVGKKAVWDEIYLISNPPYLGSSLQDKTQKEDMFKVFDGFKNYKNLDYVAIWFKKGADYIKDTNAELAFVSTNSICQGDQVALIWPYIFDINIEIGFAYSSFKWTNAATNNAGVTCVVIGLRKTCAKNKYLYDSGIRKVADNINAYLIDAQNIILPRRSNQISELPRCIMGSKPTDGGNFIMSPEEYASLTKTNPEAKKFVKYYMGSSDFINSHLRYCLWIEDADVEEAKKIEEIKKRLDAVAEFRLKRTTTSTKAYSKYPNRFRQKAYKKTQSIIVPTVSSERREYLPIGYLSENTVVSNAANVIYEAHLSVFAVLISKMHMAWVKVSSGKLKTDIRYSPSISYNNFPLIALNEVQKEQLALKARKIIFARENHSERTIAELYDPDKMPDDLREAHHQNDMLVDSLYRQKPYENDEERLADLFKLYEKMTTKEKKQS